jgi:hypothetical protein
MVASGDSNPASGFEAAAGDLKGSRTANPSLARRYIVDRMDLAK